MLFMKKPNYRKFDYQPRYYKAEEDEQEKRKRRLGFRSERHFQKKKRTPLYWFIIFAIVLYIYLQFGGYI